MQRYEEKGISTTKSPSGRPPKVKTPQLLKKINAEFLKNPNVSCHTIASKLHISLGYLSYIKVHQLGIKAYRKQPAPRYRKDQEQRAKTNCRKIYRQKVLSNPGRVLIIDDETYVPVDPKNIKGMEYYHCTNKDEVPDENRFVEKEKFYEKYLVWQCLDEFGNCSDPFITKGTINGDMYLEECIKKRMLPFIKKHHKIEDVIFWMDLARAHYKRKVTDFLIDQGIDFVSYKENAPNVPQARPIEKF